jgi:3-oxoacyl-[acyl-carrier-protein] synthase II
MNVRIAQSDLLTAYGHGMDALWKGLLSGRTAIRPTRRFDGRGFNSDQAALIPDLRDDTGETRIWQAIRRVFSPHAGKFDPQTPLILATTVGEIEFVERSVLESNWDLAAESKPEKLAERTQHLLGLRGPVIALSSACASSAAALTRAASMIRHNQAESILVVACDAVSEFVYSGFSSLASLDSEPARPFDSGRCGLTLGEAAAWALLTQSDADKDNVSILGWGNTADAVHMTAPDRNGNGLTRAIQKALVMSRQRADEINFIAAHGTGTVYSDAMELTSFGNAIGGARPVFSIKGGIGHTLGAAGLTQFLVATHALKLGIVPPSVGLTTPDESARDWAVAKSKSNGSMQLALSTNSGFGGVNTAMLLGTGGAE